MSPSGNVTKIPQPGESSPNVATMQAALHSIGYQLDVDGVFGPRTRAVVSKFQRSEGLSGTGIPGEKTMALLKISVIPVTGGIASTGQDIDEGTPPWYRRMFVICDVDQGYEKQVASTLATIERGYLRYISVANQLGYKGEFATLFAWILGCIHYKEASCDFMGVLHNGERIIGTNRMTTIVPAGRGPFSTWEESAIDAINLHAARWSKLRAGSTDIGDILYAMERFNGTGYITGAGRSDTSPYLWACSNVNDNYGKYVRDGQYDPKASVQSSAGAALLLKELYRAGKFRCTGTSASSPIPLPDLTPRPVSTLTRQVIADKIVELIERDVAAQLRETKGKNRSPRIDEFNTRAKSYLGAPYCASGGWVAIDDACKALGLKNPVPPTASSQAFRRSTFVPKKYIRPEGDLGKKGDAGVLQVPSDPNRGHYVTVQRNQDTSPTFKTVEYNTDGSGTRDGDGAYAMSRSTVDRSLANGGKIFVCFTDIPQWVLDANKT